MKRYTTQRNLLFKCLFTLLLLTFSVCCLQAQVVPVTFNIDLRNEMVTANGVSLAGTFSNWMLIPMNNDGDGTWSLTINIPNQTNIQYRFYNGDTGATIESGTALQACGVPGENNDFNRTFFVGTAPVNIPLVCFASCDPCPNEVIDEIQYVNACVGERVSFCTLTNGGLEEPLFYQWFIGPNMPVSPVTNSPCYTIDEVMLTTPLRYFCQITNSSGTSYTTQPVILELLEQDRIGGKYYANQFMIQFGSNTTQAEREQLREDFQAEKLDSCMCTLELWSMPDSLEYPPGSGNYIIEDEDKKNTAKNEPEIEEVDYNYQTEEEGLTAANTSKKTTSFSPPPPTFLPCTALVFDGVDDVVEINSNPTNSIGTNDFTLEAWIKGNPSQPVSNPLIISTRNATNIGFMFFLTQFGGPHKKLAIQINGINYLDPNTPNVLDGLSHHIAIVKTNNELFFYIDGLLNHSKTIPTNVDISSPHRLWIGKDPISTTTTPFNGLIEEVRIWETARTDQEILQTAKISLRGNENNLLAYWDFKEGVGQGIVDKTNNGYNGWIGNTVAPENTDPTWVNNCCFKNPVLTAIIDGGMQYDHPALINQLWVNPAENIDNADEDANCAIDDKIGYSYAEDNNDAYDAIYGHGTHVGGLAIKTAEEGFNATGPDVLKILNLKVFDDRNRGNLFDAACAILHAADKKAKVINCSWGYYGLPTSVIIKALETAGKDCGALVITSAGNSGYNVFDSLHYPGNHNEAFFNILQVGAVDTIRDNQYDIDCYSLLFDGVDDLVEIPGNGIGSRLGSGDFTMEVWIKAPDNQALNPLLFSNYGPNHQGFRFYFKNSTTSTNKVLAMELQGNVYAAANTPFAFNNECHHLAAVRSNDLLSLYMDGILLGSFDLIGNPDLNSMLPLWLGKDFLDQTNYLYKGSMEEVRFWNIALTANQIQNNAQQQFSVVSPIGLIAYYKMNEFGMGKITDSIMGLDGFLGKTETIEPIDPTWLEDCCTIDSTLISSTLSLQTAPYSNYSDTLVNLATWGLHHSTIPLDDMGWKMGTSMSSGVIAGVAARLFYENPAALWPDVKQCMLDNANQLAVLNGKVKEQRFFDTNVHLNPAIDCIRNIIPNTTNECILFNPNALALELLNFKGQLKDKKVFLDWEIVNAAPIIKFELERLNELTDWKKIATIRATSDKHQSYETIDHSPNMGANFYRLKVFYEDGKTEESPIVMVELPTLNNPWQIYPNPVSHMLQIVGNGKNTENTVLHLYNYAGIEVKTVYLTMDSHTTDLLMTDLPNGLYILSIKEGEKILMQERVVKMGR